MIQQTLNRALRVVFIKAVYNHWNGLVYWTGLILRFNFSTISGLVCVTTWYSYIISAFKYYYTVYVGNSYTHSYVIRSAIKLHVHTKIKISFIACIHSWLYVPINTSSQAKIKLFCFSWWLCSNLYEQMAPIGWQLWTWNWSHALIDISDTVKWSHPLQYSFWISAHQKQAQKGLKSSHHEFLKVSWTKS